MFSNSYIQLVPILYFAIIMFYLASLAILFKISTIIIIYFNIS